MPHHLLLDKLSRNFNIQGQTWTRLKSFLVGRQNRVMYRGALSSWTHAPVTSGVPRQGSVLGPLLFNLFISDISRNVSINCLLFADDTLLYHPIFSTHDEIALQSDINAVGQWSESNGMKINIAKSKVMTRSKKPLTLPHYTLHGLELTVTATYKYLGVIINNTLIWTDHVDAVVKKANKTLGFVWHVAGGSSTEALLSLYRSLVLPVLEYGLPAWSPYTADNFFYVIPIGKSAKESYQDVS